MTNLRVPIREILDETEGMLQKQLYVVFTSAVAGMEDKVMEVSDEHIAFQVSLEKRGIMFGAGPFWNEDEETWGGDGMVIIRAGSLAEAKAIAAEDPMHKSGARSFTVRPWLLNEGGFNLRLSFSDLNYRMD
jgi:uncharacterized protein YciI